MQRALKSRRPVDVLNVLGSVGRFEGAELCTVKRFKGMSNLSFES